MVSARVFWNKELTETVLRDDVVFCVLILVLLMSPALRDKKLTRTIGGNDLRSVL